MKFNETRPLYMLAELAAFLRGDKGCLWDKNQTIMSLKPYLMEEAYEVYDAIERGKPDEIKEELGDLIYQIFAQAQIAGEEKLFSIDDVAAGIIEKLIRRHPHVFGSERGDDADEITRKWEERKKIEKPERESILDGIPVHLPSILKAYRVQQKVSKIGFDWERAEDAVAKIQEEINELREAVHSGNSEEIINESGDILFSIINVMRMMKVNPDEALNRTVNKFIQRFKFIEKAASMENRRIDEMTLAELDALWERAKREM